MLTVAIASGKGGTGKTFVSTNLFAALQKSGLPVGFIDCDAEAPNALIFLKGLKEKTLRVTQKIPVVDEGVCTYCGKCYEFCSYHAIFFLPSPPVIKVTDSLCHGCGACLYACISGAISEKDVVLGEVSDCATGHNDQTLVESRVKTGVYSPVLVIKAGISKGLVWHSQKIISQQRPGNPKPTHDTAVSMIILDAPPGTSCPFIQTVVRADYVVLVTEPTPFGLSDLKQSIETLKIMNKRFGVIINRSGIGDNLVMEYMQKQRIPLLMEIPFDLEIASACAHGKLLVSQDAQWQTRFFNLFTQILKKNGNHNHKW